MATPIQCPNCGTTFRVSAEVLGKRVRCLQCHQVFAAQDAAPPVAAVQARPAAPPIRARLLEEAPPDNDGAPDEKDPPRPRRRRDRRTDYGTPGYLLALAVLPWGILILTLGGCLWALLAGAISAGSAAIARARYVPPLIRLATILGLNAVGYGIVLALLLAVFGWPRLRLSVPPAGLSRTPPPPGPGAGPPPAHQPPAPVEAPEENVPPPPPVQPLFEHGPRVYLADLQEYGVRAGPWPFTKDGTTGGNPIVVGGVRSPKGLGMHPPFGLDYAAVRYRPGKQAARFKATVAINDSSKRCFSPAIFTVRGDGKELWRSAEIAHDHVHTQECSVDVSAVDVLELRVQCLNLNTGVHAVWVQPRFLQKPDTPDVDPTAPPVWQGPVAYLSDMELIDDKSGPWPVTRNGQTGGGNPIAVNGVASPKGIGMHPPNNPGYASARFRLGKPSAIFKTAVALNDTAAVVQSQAVFEVYGDGKLLWQSLPVKGPKQPQECSVDVSGVDVLELRVRSLGSHIGLHAVWVEPRLQKADTPDR